MQVNEFFNGTARVVEQFANYCQHIGNQHNTTSGTFPEKSLSPHFVPCFASRNPQQRMDGGSIPAATPFVCDTKSPNAIIRAVPFPGS
jgi:hypothetical protein